jgi:hypothetical protein
VSSRRSGQRAARTWLELGWQTWGLGIEAAEVIALRSLAVGLGGAAASRETVRMVAEKIGTALEIQAAAATGALGADPAVASRRAISRIRRKVRANRRRLRK